MPLSLTDLALAWALIAAVAGGVVFLNRRKRHLGWCFLALLVAVLVAGNLLEAVLA